MELAAYFFHIPNPIFLTFEYSRERPALRTKKKSPKSE